MRKKKSFPFKNELIALSVVAICLTVIFWVQRTYFEPSGISTAESSAASETLSGSKQTDTSTYSAAPVSTAGEKETENSTTASNEKVVYLTFDDGPTDNTSRILDALDSGGVKATFFVIHSYDGCEAQIREIHEHGHCVALHSYSHRYNIYRSTEAYFEDLQKISDLVYEATGVRSKLIRFPGGSSNTVSKKYCEGIMTTLTRAVTEKGYVYFDWNWDSLDAAAVTNDVSTIKKYATIPIGQSKYVILLMHDAYSKTTTPQALPEIITAYKKAGYRFDVLSADSYCYHHTVNN